MFIFQSHFSRKNGSIALKQTAGSHQIACYHQCYFENELGLI